MLRHCVFYFVQLLSSTRGLLANRCQKLFATGVRTLVLGHQIVPTQQTTSTEYLRADRPLGLAILHDAACYALQSKAEYGIRHWMLSNM